jgi:hypothetical protein
MRLRSLPFALLLLCAQVFAAEKIKVEIVEETSQITTAPAQLPGTPERVDTHCTATANGNTATGDCSTTRTPASGPRAGLRLISSFSAKAILPDGTHAELTCLGLVDKDCWGIAPMVPEKSVDGGCKTSDYDGRTMTTCVTKDLGVYSAKRDKDDLVIYGPKGKLRYHIVGSW